ncbi:hypothetical protein [Desulfobacterium sp. N47]|uniref:hypothetical protein n=1 Tax=Desulfobacterium sp. N47 TaxID=3115210 RepID=UPI003F4A635A
MVLSIVIVGAYNYVFAGEWQKPWTSVRKASAQRCANAFEAYQLQSVCMENEKTGYDKMQSDFGMPNSIASKAKERCGRTFQLFQLQAVCMENEKAGYDKMMTYKKKDIRRKAEAENQKTNHDVKDTAEESKFNFDKQLWKRFATNPEAPHDYFEYDSAPQNILHGAVGQNREHTVMVMTRNMQEETVLGMFPIAINCTKQMSMVIDLQNPKRNTPMEPIEKGTPTYLLYKKVCEQHMEE